MKRYWTWLLAALLSVGAVPTQASAVLGLTIEGSIGPVTADYLVDGLAAAAAARTPVLLRIDTPGGLDASMRVIVRAILASDVPVIGFVAPNGARAASAGTYILYACHVAAMAPATNLGAATPISIGGLPGLPDSGQGEAPGGSSPESAADGQSESSSGSAMERKLVNDAAAFLRGLATLRGRNAEWAEEAVRQGVSITAEEALERGVIDLIAVDRAHLLTEVDGREVPLLTGAFALDTAGSEVEPREMDWRQRWLATLTDPTVAYILMLIGFYGLIFELANPGSVVPGVLGSIALVLALYAFQTLPVNMAGLALVGLGVAFMVAETFAPSFGALGIGGLVAFVFGSMILYDQDAGTVAVALPVIITFTALTGALLLGVVGYAVRTRHRPVVSGREEMIGAVAIADGDFDNNGSGWVRVHSELWRARGRTPIRDGQTLDVTGIDGLVLDVEPRQQNDR